MAMPDVSRVCCGSQIGKKALILLDVQELLPRIPRTCTKLPRTMADIEDVDMIITHHYGYSILPSRICPIRFRQENVNRSIAIQEYVGAALLIRWNTQ